MDQLQGYKKMSEHIFKDTPDFSALNVSVCVCVCVYVCVCVCVCVLERERERIKNFSLVTTVVDGCELGVSLFNFLQVTAFSRFVT